MSKFMIKFKKIELTDKIWMDKIIKSSNYNGSNFNFSNIYLWDKSFTQEIAKFKDFLVIRHNKNGRLFYATPLGFGNLKEVILELKGDSKLLSKDFMIKGITRETAKKLYSLFPRKIKFTPNRNRFDYVYNIDKLCNLSGKKLQSKRNHINRFCIDNDSKWSFEPITEGNILECFKMNEDWLNSNLDTKDESMFNENIAINRAFNKFKVLGLEGGLIRLNGRVIAFTIGELLTQNMYVIHFEKAFKNINGAYPMINREFARFIRDRHPYIKYINREEDMGIKGLRRAKLSYYPDCFIEKYIAKFLF